MAARSTPTAEKSPPLPIGVPELEAGAITAPKARKTLSNPYLHRLQRRHFMLFDVLPFFGTAAAIAFLAVHPIGVPEIALFAGAWLVTGLGITVGFHRLFTHRTFK